MALRDKMAERARPFLDQDEQVQEIFQAQGGVSPYFFFLLIFLVWAQKFRIVVVTNKGIVVLESGKSTGANPKVLLRRLPRETRIGKMKGLWGKTESLGEKVWIHRRFHEDVRRADGAIQAPPGAAPPA